MGRTKKEKIINNPRLLTEEEFKEFSKYTSILECDSCGNLPQVIEKLIPSGYSSYVDKKHKCYCPICQKGTGFSGSDYYVIEQWNKMVQPLKYENCYVYSFHPIKDNNGILLDEFNCRFNIEQHEIVQRKGGKRFLYYILEHQEKKLDLDRFIDDVAIYRKSSFGVSYELEDIDVCVVIAENVDIAIEKLNKGIKDEIEQKRNYFLKVIEDKKDWLRKAEKNLSEFEKYVKEIHL